MLGVMNGICPGLWALASGPSARGRGPPAVGGAHSLNASTGSIRPTLRAGR